MADIEEALYYVLSQDEAIASGIASRVYPMQLPQGVTFPAVTFMKVSAPRDHVQKGPSGLVSSRFQVSAWAQNYSAARQAAALVRLALIGYRGVVASGVRIGGVLMVNERDLEEPDAKLWQRASDFMIFHDEEVPV